MHFAFVSLPLWASFILILSVPFNGLKIFLALKNSQRIGWLFVIVVGWLAFTMRRGYNKRTEEVHWKASFNYNQSAKWIENEYFTMKIRTRYEFEMYSHSQIHTHTQPLACTFKTRPYENIIITKAQWWANRILYCTSAEYNNKAVEFFLCPPLRIYVE